MENRKKESGQRAGHRGRKMTGSGRAKVAIRPASKPKSSRAIIKIFEDNRSRRGVGMGAEFAVTHRGKIKLKWKNKGPRARLDHVLRDP